jgi:hypothetical protein
VLSDAPPLRCRDRDHLRGVYFALSAAAYASQGYSIYYTADYLMIAGWFWAVYFASKERWAAMAAVVLASAWAKRRCCSRPC